MSPVTLTRPSTSQSTRNCLATVGPSSCTPNVRLDADLPADTLFVVEISSFQLQDSPEFHPHAAAILNLTPYLDDPDETAKVMFPDGAFRTGDIGVMDDAGYVKIVDRKKDMILVSGFNVYPNEVEGVVAQMPGVLEVAAVSQPDDRSGEVVALFVVRKDPAITEEVLRDFCRQSLTAYKVPKLVVFAATLPYTATGKVRRLGLA